MLIKKEVKEIYYGSNKIKSVYLGTSSGFKKIRPKEVKALKLIANADGIIVGITKAGTPYSTTIETSRDGKTRTDYNFGDITLSKTGDYVYFRNKGATNYFSKDGSNYYRIYSTGSFDCEGDVCYLLNKDGTDTINYSNFIYLFSYSKLRKPPRIGAKYIIQKGCYGMFMYCRSLIGLPNLSGAVLGKTGWTASSALELMFYGCGNIKISSTQTGEYQNAYTTPTIGISGATEFGNMFAGTGGTFTGTPTAGTTYYTSNEII